MSSFSSLYNSSSLSINSKGHLTIGGCDAVDLASEFGTPLYVMDEDNIRSVLRSFKSSINGYDKGGMVAYASKACSFKELYRIVMDEGCGVDVASGGELYTAVQVGFPPENIIFHGNNKTDNELIMALKFGVGRIVVDSALEMERLAKIAEKLETVAPVFIRLKPDVETDTFKEVQTGQEDSKFGVSIKNGEAMELVKYSLENNFINLIGVHCHIGSQIHDNKPFYKAAKKLIYFLAEVRSRFGAELGEINIGGGFGIKYTDDDTPLEPSEYMNHSYNIIKKCAEDINFPVPFIIIEPGRSIVAHSGITLYTVGVIKDIPDIRKYVTVDGSMADSPRYALYKSKYTVVVANKASHPANDLVTIAGRCCESGDLIQKDTIIQAAETGDIIAVLDTGAYNYAMSSNYNRLPRPAVIMVSKGNARVVVKAETYEDIIRNDI